MYDRGLRSSVLLVFALTACRIGFDELVDSGPRSDDGAPTDGSGDGLPSAWTIASPAPGTTDALWGVHAFAPDDIWVSGALGVLEHFDGAGWTQKVNPASDTLFYVWGLAPEDVWAVGRACTTLGWDGAMWSTRSTPPCGPNANLFAVGGSNATNIWIVGTTGTIFQNKGAWIDRSSGNIDYWDVAATSLTEVILVGTRGTVAHWDGTAFALPPTTTSETLASIWHAGNGEYWIVGGGGTILHKTSTSGWVAVTSPTTEFLYGVAGTAPDDIWAVGSAGTILHYDGATWARAQSPTSATLRNLALVPGGGLRAVGDGGLLLSHP